MTSLNILSGGAAHGLVASLAPRFKRETGFDIAGEYGAVGAMADKLRQGQPTDLSRPKSSPRKVSSYRERCPGATTSRRCIRLP